MDLSSTAVGLLEQVKPFFLIPAVAMAGFGAVIASPHSIGTAIVHASAVAVAVYVAHLVDTYVDSHLREEDDSVSLSEGQLETAVVASSVVFFVLVLVLGVRSDISGALVTVPLWLLAIAHAPVLDRHPIGVTFDYPLGIGLAFIGGYVVQSGTVTAEVFLTAISYVLILSGCKIAIDQLDYEQDLSISKRTVPVVVGRERSDLYADAFVVAGAVSVTTLGLFGSLGPVAVLASACPLAGLLVARRIGSIHKSIAVSLSMYPFTALLFVALSTSIL